MCWVDLDFLAKLIDVHSQVMVLFATARPPDLQEQLTMRQYHSCMFNQCSEQPEFVWREVDQLVVQANFSSREIDFQFPDLKYWIMLVAFSLVGMPERHSHAREQLSDAEGLGKIVVCPCVECDDLILFLPPSGDDDDWDGGPFANALRNVDTVDVR